MSESGEWIVRCADCSLPIDEAHDAPLGGPPCPECGSRCRSARWSGPNGAHVLIRDKAQKKPGQRKPSSESIKGDVYSVARGKMVRIHRIIDRRRDLYYEKIHDPDTREVMHEVEEPLSEHRGHGSAKLRSD